MRKERKRGAVELSINTIVIVVIGITLLTLGLRWLTTIFSGVDEQTTQLQRVSEQQIMAIFGESDSLISMAQSRYQVDQGKTLSNIQIYLRNSVEPGGTYSFAYSIIPLSVPPSIEQNVVRARMDWVKTDIELTSGSAYQDTVLFNTKNLPLGVYKFQGSIQCKSAGCSDQEHLQFIVEVV